MLIKECKIDANMFNHKQEKITPAFYHTYEYDHTTVSGYIKAHPSVVQLYQKHVSNCGDISLPASKLPMLVPPRPWTSITDGGHLLFSGNALNCPAQTRVEQLKVEQLSCLNTTTFDISFSSSAAYCIDTTHTLPPRLRYLFQVVQTQITAAYCRILPTLVHHV